MQTTNRVVGLFIASLLSSAVFYGQSAQVIYEQDDNFPLATTEFRSPWNGGDLGNGNYMPAPTGRIIATNDAIFSTAVIRVRLQNFTGGDGFGRLALAAGNGFRRTGSSAYQLPGDRANGLGSTNQSGTVLFGTWVGSGHTFGLRAAANDNSLTASAEARADVELRNASMVNLSSAPSITPFSLSSYLWGSNYIDPMAFPNVALNWNIGAISGTRGLINFALFGNLASPHSDRLRLRYDFAVYQNSALIYSDSNESFVDWTAGDAAFSKSVSGLTGAHTIDISNDFDGTQYAVVLRVRVLHDGYRDNFASYAGTVTLFDQTFSDGFTVLVPEPASMLALGTGLVGLLGLRRRKQ